MTQTNQKSRKVERQSGFAVSPVAAGCAVLLISVAGAAHAQQASGEVVVTGIRASIENAIATKRNSDGIVEALSAEDIGKLPDSTVAESISRLPGVTAQRNKSTGRAQSVSVRGMSPDFNGALLNGREQASTGDSRGVEFDQFPAELLSSIVIHKTPEASLVGQGLASTIDLRTVRPLDFNKRTFSANVRSQRSGVDSGAGEGKGDRQSFSYVDQFADRTLGIALGYTKLKDTGAEQLKFNSWGGWNRDIMYNGKTVTIPGGFTADTEQSSSNRDGLMAVIQFKPNKDFETTLDVFSSKGTFALKKTGLEGAFLENSTYDPPGKLLPGAVVNAAGIVTSGTMDGYKGVIRNHLESGDDKLDSFGWNTKFKVGDWKAAADIAQSKVSRLSQRYETTAGLPGNGNTTGRTDTMSWTGFNGNNLTDAKFTTGLSYADRSLMKLTDVDGWSGGPSAPQAGYVALPSVSDKVDNWRLSGRRNVEYGPISSIEIGANFSDRTKVRTTQEGRLMIKGGDPYAGATAPGSATSVAGTTGLAVISWDPRGSLGTIYDLAKKVDADILNKDWSVSEKVTTTYVKGDMDGTFMGMPYRGNVGAQLVNTDQNSTGFNVNRATCTGSTAATCPGITIGNGKQYSDFNPSLNLNFDRGDDQVVRLGVAKVLARPNMGDMRASMGMSYDSTKGMYTGDGGNPGLEPFRAKSFDVSYEKYFGKKGYISVAGFYKKLDTYILKTATPFDFKGLTPAGFTYPTMGMLTRPINGQGGDISGIELAINVPFSMLTPTLDGFGVMVNKSSTSSSVSLPTSAFSTQEIGKDKIPLPGLSKDVTNMRLYYEKSGFQVAVAGRKRSDFLGEISDFQDNRQLTFIKGETVVDLQAGYEFQQGPAKGMSILFQVNNASNAQFQRYSNTPDNVVEKVRYGKVYLMGATYKF
jgi:iron complex outermembrane receptor protein